MAKYKSFSRKAFENWKGKFLRFSVLLSIIILGSVLNVKAQIGVSVGPKAGVTITSFSGDAAGKVEAKTTGVGGLFANVHFLKYFALQPEAFIHQKGATTSSNGVTNSVKVNYFEVPVLFKVMLPVEDHIYPNLFIGPTFSYKMNSSASTKNTETGTVVNFNEGDVRKQETGGIIGGGFDFETQHIFINLDARYGFGFNSLGSNTLELKNRNWAFMLGLGYRIGTNKDKE